MTAAELYEGTGVQAVHPDQQADPARYSPGSAPVDLADADLGLQGAERAARAMLHRRADSPRPSAQPGRGP
ncbi:hypothetical protein [Streptomyces aurantiogriseus]|uniref:Uncharacterized protein n=1 Tax=Streptomyces aurantiogriseus TaxID=66870 RepID=A0A918FH66_9ACTN|nr:hypothetical protein [Streptomyces aurantiogriseus]GGR37287.1 hypothetical protein GCM10010251_62320 [Streptomyces aurantiogriseus]